MSSPTPNEINMNKTAEEETLLEVEDILQWIDNANKESLNTHHRSSIETDESDCYETPKMDEQSRTRRILMSSPPSPLFYEDKRVLHKLHSAFNNDSKATDTNTSVTFLSDTDKEEGEYEKEREDEEDDLTEAYYQPRKLFDVNSRDHSPDRTTTLTLEECPICEEQFLSEDINDHIMHCNGETSEETDIQPNKNLKRREHEDVTIDSIMRKRQKLTLDNDD
ncbi:hypothetical protein BDB01DRAFT_789011 [Pilobolus umbonatus]|nr:hypothetical protein BDB01DRAFT_789011 [Pilobolus umbonatus]